MICVLFVFGHVTLRYTQGLTRWFEMLRFAQHDMIKFVILGVERL